MTVRITQLSDTHLSHDFPQRTADLALCVERINALDQQPDLVVHTGDIADYGLAEQYDIARSVLDELNAPYCVLAGNRDSRDELRSAFAGVRLMPKQFEFVQYSIEHFDTRILVLDTLLEKQKKGQICDVRFMHLEQMLAADTVKPAAIFMHHPPFEANEIPDPFQFEQWADVDRFSALLARYPNVTGVYCGHLHRNITATTGNLPASSVSCVAGDLRWDVANDADRALPMFRSLLV